jgi:hypothetical protein
MYTKRKIRAELRKQLKQYEVFVDDLDRRFSEATPDERKALHDWVADGNSVYDNPSCLAGEDGKPLCYIAAVRLAVDMLNHPEDYSF